MNRVNKDDIIAAYEHSGSIKEVARILGISHIVVRRTLCSAGIYASERLEKINKLYMNGKTPNEISALMGISEKAVKLNLPYTRKSYSTSLQTLNAQRIQTCRERKCRNNKKEP